MIGSSNCANEEPPMSMTLEDEILSDVENRYVVFSELPTQISPDWSVMKFGVASVVGPRFTSDMLIVALAAVFERGT